MTVASTSIIPYPERNLQPSTVRPKSRVWSGAEPDVRLLLHSGSPNRTTPSAWLSSHGQHVSVSSASLSTAKSVLSGLLDFLAVPTVPLPEEILANHRQEKVHLGMQEEHVQKAVWLWLPATRASSSTRSGVRSRRLIAMDR